MEKFQSYIGGEWVDGEAGSYEIVNPATEEIVGHAPQVTVNQSLAATEAAAAAGWTRTRPQRLGGSGGSAEQAVRTRTKSRSTPSTGACCTDGGRPRFRSSASCADPPIGAVTQITLDL